MWVFVNGGKNEILLLAQMLFTRASKVIYID